MVHEAVEDSAFSPASGVAFPGAGAARILALERPGVPIAQRGSCALRGNQERQRKRSVNTDEPRTAQRIE
jgi:hypothetical protein